MRLPSGNWERIGRRRKHDVYIAALCVTDPKQSDTRAETCHRHTGSMNPSLDVDALPRRPADGPPSWAKEKNEEQPMLHLASVPPSECGDRNNSLWLMVAAALVLLMTPGVAFFYGGMVKAKCVISMMMMSFGAIAMVACCGCSTATHVVLQLAADPPLAWEPIRRQEQSDRALSLRVRQRHARCRPSRWPGVRRLPGDLRDHHGRADLGCDRRPGEVRLLDGLRGRLGHPGLLPGRELGVQLHSRRQLGGRIRPARLLRWRLVGLGPRRE